MLTVLWREREREQGPGSWKGPSFNTMYKKSRGQPPTRPIVRSPASPKQDKLLTICKGLCPPGEEKQKAARRSFLVRVPVSYIVDAPMNVRTYSGVLRSIYDSISRYMYPIKNTTTLKMQSCVLVAITACARPRLRLPPSVFQKPVFRAETAGAVPCAPAIRSMADRSHVGKSRSRLFCPYYVIRYIVR